MIEPRKVPLLSMPEKDKLKNSEDFGPTIRFNIKLELPIESISSEYSYIDLNDGNNNEKDKHVDETPFEREEREEMEKLQKIADGFNSKYGGSTKKSKKRNIRDLVDKGEGYCEDSFVDNSEAYDLVVPWCLDTKHGGFYINEGVLDFIKNDETYPEEEEPKKKKKKLDDNQDGIKKKSKEQKKPKLKRKLISDVEDSDKNEADIKPPTAVLPTKLTPTPALPTKLTPTPAPQPEKSLPVVIEKIDQSMVVEEEVSELDESFNFEEPVEDPTVGQLIGELTSEILQKVAHTRALQSPSTTGDNQAPSLFTSNLVESLTRLHTLCQKRKPELKHSIFESIASACNCQREQLYKKVKRYRMNLLSEEMNKRKAELKEAVDKVMPALMDKYKHDLDESNKLKKELMTKEVHGSCDSDEDDGGKNEAEKAKRIMAPRRKFIWSLEIRNLLCEVVSLKLRHFDMAKIKSQTAEEHLKTFLDTDIKFIWPSGWILTRALFKESKPAHANWTGDQIKTKKATPMATQPVINKPQLPSQQVQQPIQQQSNSQLLTTQKPINPPQTPMKPVEDPTVINLDDSDNEQSKVPSTPIGKNINKNVFTVLKEKSSQEAGKLDAKPQKMEIHADHSVVSHQNAKAHDSQKHEVISSNAVNNNVSHATIILSSPQAHQKVKDPQSRNVSGSVQDSSKFARPATLQMADSRDSMKDAIFHGKFVNNLKQIQSSLIQSVNKVKSSAVTEECVQEDQVDLTGESPQHSTPRKRTLSQNTHVETAQTSKVDISPAKQSAQRIAFDVNNQSQSQRNATTAWESNVFQQSQTSSQLYHQLQQQYQQLHQQRQQQQQLMKKSPKQDKVIQVPTKATPSIPHANYIPVVQQQSLNVAGSTLTSPKVQHQQNISAKANAINDGFVQDHHQDQARVRPNETSGLQHGFTTGAPFPSNETKTNQFQKSPMKKEINLTQHPSYVAFQNLSPPGKQFQQFVQKPLQGQGNQQCLKSQTVVSQITSPPKQQHFNQQLFHGQKLSQDNSAQHKN